MTRTMAAVHAAAFVFYSTIGIATLFMPVMVFELSVYDWRAYAPFCAWCIFGGAIFIYCMARDTPPQ